MRVEHQISLSPFTTFGVEARAKHLVRLESREDLEALRTVREKDEPLLIIGAGSYSVHERFRWARGPEPYNGG